MFQIRLWKVWPVPPAMVVRQVSGCNREVCVCLYTERRDMGGGVLPFGPNSFLQSKNCLPFENTHPRLLYSIYRLERLASTCNTLTRRKNNSTDHFPTRTAGAHHPLTPARTSSARCPTCGSRAWPAQCRSGRCFCRRGASRSSSTSCKMQTATCVIGSRLEEHNLTFHRTMSFWNAKRARCSLTKNAITKLLLGAQANGSKDARRN